MAQVGLWFPLLSPSAEEMLPDWLVSYIGCCFRMTHLASFVPAESATLGIVDKSAWFLGLTAASPPFFFSYSDVQFSPAFKPGSRSQK